MIEATTDITRAAVVAWDVVVVGAGPAGTLSARECARHGLRVLLIDKSAFPRYKVCGCCINNRTRQTLRQAGLEHLLQDAVPLHAFHVASRERIAQVPLPKGYVSLSRERLDAALVRAAIEAGAQFLPETKASLGNLAPESREINVEGRAAKFVVPASVGVRPPIGRTTNNVRARVVLAADGLAGNFSRGVIDDEVLAASRVGIGAVADLAPAYFESGVTYMACGRHGYLGLQRLENDRLDLAAAVDTHWMRHVGGPAAAADALLAEAGFPAIPELPVLDWKGTPPLTRRAAHCTLPRVLVLGDAAGYIEPFTGEGIAWAVTSAMAAAPIVARAVDRYDETFERAWRNRHRALVTRRQWICKTMAAGLRHPVLVRTVVAMLAAMPALARPFVWRINAIPQRRPAAEPGLRS